MNLYITFSKGHQHNIKGFCFEHETLACINAEYEFMARKLAYNFFGVDWNFEFTPADWNPSPNQLRRLFPNGLIHININGQLRLERWAETWSLK